MPWKNSWSDEQLINAVKNSTSLRECLKFLGLKYSGSQSNRIKKIAQSLRVDMSHFIRYKLPLIKQRNLKEILTVNQKISTYHLKLRLIKEEVFEHKCYKCGLKEWDGKPIPIELEHKNGIRTDFRIENLTILCPNCHAQTPTYRGKNKKSFKD